MSDEDAFLSALKANPADDTTRLVYADWLDEHGEPAKADHLRSVVRLAQPATAIDLTSTPAVELLARETRLPRGWCETVGGRFDLLLVGARPDKIVAIKTLREVLGLGLAACKTISETLPAGLIGSGCLAAVTDLVRALRPANTMQFLVQTCDSPERVAPRLFYPVVEPWPIALTGVEEAQEPLAAAVGTVLGSDAADIVMRSRGQNQSVLIRTPVTVQTVLRLKSELAARPNAPLDWRFYVNVSPAPAAST